MKTPKFITLWVYHWEAGQELIVIDVGNDVLLKPKTLFSESNINDVASCLKYKDKAKTIFLLMMMNAIECYLGGDEAFLK